MVGKEEWGGGGSRVKEKGEIIGMGGVVRN